MKHLDEQKNRSYKVSSPALVLYSSRPVQINSNKLAMSQGNKRSFNSMIRRENLDSFPTDLIIEIFSRLRAKSVGRFRSLSKLWACELRRPDFTELFLTRSSAHPRLLFAVEREGEWCFFSLPQPQKPYDKSSLVVAADFHTKLSKDDIKPNICSYASGLIYFPDISVCNPITGQSLPKQRRYRNSKSFLGFDPINKQFKVLVMANGRHMIMTLGTGEMSWREIQCPFHHAYHESWGKGICINGVLYYLVFTVIGATRVSMIVCFDVRSEKFKVIDGKSFGVWGTKLINYKGKLGGIDWRCDGDDNTLELCVWVLEDIEKQEWSKHVYTLPENEVVVRNFFVVGMTNTGEIVLSEMYTSKRFYVFYFNPESNTLQSVEIQDFGENRSNVYAFVDHVEDLNFIK